MLVEIDKATLPTVAGALQFRLALVPTAQAEETGPSSGGPKAVNSVLGPVVDTLDGVAGPFRHTFASAAGEPLHDVSGLSLLIEARGLDAVTSEAHPVASDQIELESLLAGKRRVSARRYLVGKLFAKGMSVNLGQYVLTIASPDKTGRRSKSPPHGIPETIEEVTEPATTVVGREDLGGTAHSMLLPTLREPELDAVSGLSLPHVPQLNDIDLSEGSFDLRSVLSMPNQPMQGAGQGEGEEQAAARRKQPSNAPLLKLPSALPVHKSPLQSRKGSASSASSNPDSTIPPAAARPAAKQAKAAPAARVAAAAAAPQPGGLLDAAGTAFTPERDVPQPGQLLVLVVAHSATELPLIRSNEWPTPVLTVALESEEHGCSVSSKPTASPTRNPTWHEELALVFSEDKIQSGHGVVLSAFDSKTNEELLRFVLPVRHLAPYHQYNFELVQSVSPSPDTLPGNVYATVTIVPPREHEHGTPTMEVAVGRFKEPLPNPIYHRSRVLAVARLVPDHKAYLKRMQDAPHTIPPARSLWTVSLPGAKPSSFVPSPYSGIRGTADSATQVVTAQGTGREKAFGRMFYFTYPMAAVFSPSSGLAIEYYVWSAASESNVLLGRRPQASAGKSAHTWMPTFKDLVGYTCLPLTADLHRAAFESAEGGAPVTVPVKGKLALGRVLHLDISFRAYLPLQPETRPTSTASIGPRRRDVMAIDPNVSLFDVADAARSGTLTDFDAGQALNVSVSDTLPSETTRVRLHDVDIQRFAGDMQSKQAMIDRLTQQIDQRAAAIKRIGAELLELRAGNLKSLKIKSELKKRHAENEAAAKVAIDKEALAGVSRDQLVHAYVDLSNRYGAEMERYQEYDTRIKHLQNALIVKNESHKLLLELEAEHKKQSVRVQKLQERAQRVGKYEDTCKKQLEVIVRLEDLIGRNHGTLVDRATSLGSPTYKKLLKENTGLRKRLVDLQASLSQQAHTKPSGLDVYLSGGAALEEDAHASRLEVELRELMRRSSHLQEENAMNKASGLGDVQRLQLLMRTEAAEQRCVSLADELRDSTRQHQRRVSELQSQIMQRATEHSRRHSPRSLGQLRTPPRSPRSRLSAARGSRASSSSGVAAFGY